MTLSDKVNQSRSDIKSIVPSFVFVHRSFLSGLAVDNCTMLPLLCNKAPHSPTTRWQISANCSKTMWTADDRRFRRAAETALGRCLDRRLIQARTEWEATGNRCIVAAIEHSQTVPFDLCHLTRWQTKHQLSRLWDIFQRTSQGAHATFCVSPVNWSFPVIHHTGVCCFWIDGASKTWNHSLVCRKSRKSNL